MNWSGFRRKLCLGNILCNIPEFISQDCGKQKTDLTLVRWSNLNSDFPTGRKFFPHSAPIFGVTGLCKLNMMIILAGKHQRGYRVLRFSRFAP